MTGSGAPWPNWVSGSRIRRWATFSVGMASLLLLRENRLAGPALWLIARVGRSETSL
jgi:hypothetical protein